MSARCSSSSWMRRHWPIRSRRTATALWMVWPSRSRWSWSSAMSANTCWRRVSRSGSTASGCCGRTVWSAAHGCATRNGRVTKTTWWCCAAVVPCHRQPGWSWSGAAVSARPPASRPARSSVWPFACDRRSPPAWHAVAAMRVVAACRCCRSRCGSVHRCRARRRWRFDCAHRMGRCSVPSPSRKRRPWSSR